MGFDFTTPNPGKNEEKKAQKISTGFDFSTPAKSKQIPKKNAVPKPKQDLLPNVNPQFAQNHPILNNVLETVSTPLRSVFENPFVQRSSQAGNEVRFLTENPNKVSTGNSTADFAADFMGGMAGFIGAGPAPSAGGQIFGAGAKATTKALPKLTQKPILKTGAGMAGGSVAFETADALANDRPISPAGVGMAAAQNAALGALTHGAVRAIPKIAKAKSKFDFTKQKPAEAAEIKAEPIKEEPVDYTKLKDLGGYRLYMTDVFRNFKDVLGKHYKPVKQRLLDPFDASKKTNVEFQEQWLNRLKTEVVDKLKIRKGSKKSALVQKYGEGNISLEKLKKQRPKDWKDIVEADAWFRKSYDELLDRVNAIRQEIYPNNPEKIVPKRSNYYRHFRELDGFEGLKNTFDNPAQIDPSLMGISDFTLPNSRWASFMQRRGIGPYKEDAVGGFLNYLPAGSYSMHIDPHIGKFKGFADELAEATKETKNLNNFIGYLQKFSQDLAGKTNPMDRFIQDVVPGGRKTFHGINWLNNRVKANTVLANASSALAQTANIPQGIAFAKQHSIPGVGKTLLSIFKPNMEIAKSGFIKERYGGAGSKMYRQFDTKLLSKPKNFAVWTMETADRIGTNFIWNSAYSKGKALKVPNPVKYADDVTRRLIAGRGIGEVPLMQRSKLFQLVGPFQLEVANLWSVQREFVKEKDFGAMVTLALASFIFNKAMESIKGSGVMFDPIQAMIDASEEGLTPIQRAGRLGGEVLSNLPLGQTVANSPLFPEYGGNVLGINMPARKQLFGENDPTRFGTGLLALKATQEPFTKIIPSFGGGQIKKTWKGLDALANEGVYNKDFTKLKYPIMPTPMNATKGLLFGPGGFGEARDYYGNNRRPLSEKQTEEFNLYNNAGLKPMAQNFYKNTMTEWEISKLEKQIKAIEENMEIPWKEKARKIAELQNKIYSLYGKKGW